MLFGPVITNNVSLPYSAMLFITIGTNPQCKPNITAAGQIKPRIPPAIIGLKPTNAVYPDARSFPAVSEIGPITRYVAGTMIIKLSIGVRNVLHTDGTIFFKPFSNFDNA